jgi:AAA domain
MTQQASQTSWTSKVVKSGDQKILQPRILLYAPPGVGKSTFGSTLPKPLFIDFDKGADFIKVDRIPAPATWTETLSLIREIARNPMGYESLVIDTVDPLEELAIAHVCREGEKKNIGAFNHGDGYIAVGMEWRILLSEIDAARNAGMLVCLLGHATVKQMQDPQIGTFDQFTSQLGKKAWAITQRYVDFVGFACFDSALVEKKDENKRATVTGERIMYTQRSSGCEAKNRFALPPKMPLSWAALREGIARHSQTATFLRDKILKLASGTPLEAKTKGYLSEAGDDLNTLLEIELQLTSALTLQASVQVAVDAPTPAPVTVPEVAPASPPPQSPETIELRIFELAKGTIFEASAREFVSEANKDIKTLLTIEERLSKRLDELKAQGGAVATGAN